MFQYPEHLRWHGAPGDALRHGPRRLGRSGRAGKPGKSPASLQGNPAAVPHYLVPPRSVCLQALLIPIFALSGRLIVSAFDFLPSATPRTYPQLGKAAAGTAGLRAVMLFSFLELFGGRYVQGIS